MVSPLLFALGKKLCLHDSCKDIWYTSCAISMLSIFAAACGKIERFHLKKLKITICSRFADTDKIDGLVKIV